MSLSIKDIPMKNTLGKIILFFLVTLDIFASSQLAEYSLTSNKIEAYEKEPITITFKAQQKNHHDVMFFFLEPKQSDTYKIILLKQDSKELSYHNKRSIFTFLLFPLVEGKIKVEFNFTIKVASDDAVAEVFKGSRDNVKWIETTNTLVKLTPLVLNVQALKERVDLIGNFKISSKIDKDHINEYDSVNITYYLQGVGYNDINLDLISKIDNVKIFSDASQLYDKASKNGYRIQRELKYALLSTKDFTVPAKKLRCYSPKTKSYYTIQTKAYHVNVTPMDKTELIDTVEYPQGEDSYKDIKIYLIYLFIFLAGFITAKVIPKSIGFLNKETPYSDIQNSSNAKDLLQQLLNSYNTANLKSEISDLEAIAYKNSPSNRFKSIKKDIIKKLEQ